MNAETTNTMAAKNHSWIGVERFKQTRRSAFTLIELLVVIAIIGLLAGLVVALTNQATVSSRRSRIRAELNQLVTAIEAYKAKRGSLPPDNIVTRPPWTPTFVVNPLTNQLLYELTGTVIENNRFRIPNRNASLDSPTIRSFFNIEGFAHASANPKEIIPFLNPKATQVGKISPDVEVLVVPVAWPLNNPNPPINSTDPIIRQVNPWRYVSTHPTNNPNGFDLWAEFVEGKKIRIICNWSKDVLDKP